MSIFVIDVESDGPAPGLYSMVSFGAVMVDDLKKTFYGTTRPISVLWIPEALAVSGVSRSEHEQFEYPDVEMRRFAEWIEENTTGRPMFYSDNNGFDWQFINYYFHRFYHKNPFGFSSTNIGSLYKGMQKDMFVNFKHLRKTKHTHNPVDDAKGNAEALIAMKGMGLKISF